MPYIVTADHLKAIAGKPTPLMSPLAEWMNTTCPGYGIDTPQEYAHFLAQACLESARFSTLRELGGNSYFTKYENRADLGNKFPGDGLKFKGRGIFQTTGRNHYLKLGITKGNRDMFINNPELLEQPEFAVWSACEFWKDKGFTDIANHPDTDLLKKKIYLNRQLTAFKLIDVSPLEYISRTINGGINGLPERKQFYAIAKKVLV